MIYDIGWNFDTYAADKEIPILYGAEIFVHKRQVDQNKEDKMGWRVLER
jgi:hypothetical protein